MSMQLKSRKLQETGTEIAIVIGGGNIFRGVSGASKGMDRVQADYMGMLATVINGLALQSALENNSVPTRLQTAIKIEAIAEPFIKRRATRHLEKRKGSYFWIGNGKPLFHNRFCSSIACHRNQCRCDIEREQSRWYLQRRSRKKQRSHKI